MTTLSLYADLEKALHAICSNTLLDKESRVILTLDHQATYNGQGKIERLLVWLA